MARLISVMEIIWSYKIHRQIISTINREATSTCNSKVNYFCDWDFIRLLASIRSYTVLIVFLQAFSDDDSMGGDIPEGFTADDLLSDSESDQASAKQKNKKQTTESKNKKEKRKKKKGSALEEDIDDDEKVGEALTNL